MNANLEKYLLITKIQLGKGLGFVSLRVILAVSITRACA